MTARPFPSPTTAWTAPAFAPVAGAVARAAVSSPTPTTVPVYVPGYSPAQWSLLRGSVVGSVVSSASAVSAETTYTIFCNNQASSSCRLADELPFVFAEGPSVLRYTGVASGTMTANLDCRLAGTTAATCTGYTSYAPGFAPDPNPTASSATALETRWTSTFNGSSVQWGVLTLSVPPSTSGGLDVTGGGGSDGAPSESGGGYGIVPTSGLLYTTVSSSSAPPSSTGAARRLLALPWAIAVAAYLVCF